MSKSKSTSSVGIDDLGSSSSGAGDKVVISQYANKMPVVTFTDKSGNKSVKSIGGAGLIKAYVATGAGENKKQ
jgi:hypothetical protein